MSRNSRGNMIKDARKRKGRRKPMTKREDGESTFVKGLIATLKAKDSTE